MSKHPNYPQPVNDPESLPKNYDAAEAETRWQQYWDECGVYRFEPHRPDGSLRTREEIFSIDTPPPTVSGKLHIGHVYSYTQTDMNARYQRMRGKHVFYPFGFDDNGLPTERLVESVTGKRANDVIAEGGREAFIELCKPIVEGAEQEFIALWKSLALSCDWDQFYTTIGTIRSGSFADPGLARAISQSSFIDLYNRGFIYRKVAPTQWDWVNQTAIAQAEIEDREVQGHFHDIRFGWADGPGEPVKGELIIATTRPELIPACVAVFAHPDDARYKHLFGKVAITPLFKVEVPILPSEKANPEKGTGILMCCTFGDMDDVEHWKEHNLPLRVIIGRDGKIGDFIGKYMQVGGDAHGKPFFSQIQGNEMAEVLEAPSRNAKAAIDFLWKIQGAKVKQARDRIRDLLQESGDLLSMKDVVHTVRHAERGDVPVEILVTPQWYVNILDHKDALIEQGRKVKWHPEYMRKRYEQWVEGLNTDWCISRQRYNGVPFVHFYVRGQGQLMFPPSDCNWPRVDDLPLNPLLREHRGKFIRQVHLDCLKVLRSNPDVQELAYWSVYYDGMMGDWVTNPTTREQITELKGKQLESHFEVSDLSNGIAFCRLARELSHAIICLYQPEPIPTDDRFLAQIESTLLDVKDTVLGSLVDEVIADSDVMDTWATSSTTPFLNTHLLLKRDEVGQLATSERHAQLFPFDMRPQAHDIIRTWAFYTIAKAYFHFGEIPWKDIVISGHAQDAGGKKISKSKGHVVTPAEMVEKYSADGLRYWSGSVRLGTDTLYDERNLTEGRKLINKLFNATKFALRHLLDYSPGGVEEITYPTDLWLLGRLNETIDRATKANDAFEFGEAKQAAEDFFWADLCDNYLELSKGRLYGEPLAVDAHSDSTPEQLRRSAQATLHIALSSVLRLFAPVLPHITEECWSWHFARFSNKLSIHEEEWPVVVPVGAAHGRPEQDGAPETDRPWAVPTGQAASLLLHTVSAVRKWKSEHNVSVKKPLAAVQIYLTEHAPKSPDGASLLADDHLHAIIGDLLATCNAQQAVMVEDATPPDAVSSERGWVAVTCEIAEAEG